MLTLKRLATASWVIGLCGGWLIGAAYADESSLPTASGNSESSSGELEEIVVTAQKRSERLQDVPIAVSTASGDQLDSSGITNTMQLASIIPGLQISSNGGNFEPRLRGIGSSATGPGVEESVALVVDGVYYADPLFGPGQLFGVDQVAVLKGPQGTLFGRNATGGVIQVTTKDPTQEFEGQVRTSLDNFLTSRSDLYVAGGLTDTLTTSLSGEYAHQGRGWGTDIDTGQEIHEVTRDVAARSKWVYTPSNDTTVKVIFDYRDTANTNGNNTRPAPGTAPLFGGYQQSDNPWNTDEPSAGYFAMQGGGASLNINQNLDFAQLVSISAYRQGFGTIGFWNSSSSIPNEYVIVDNAFQQVTEEIQLVSPSNPIFNWVAGLYYFYGKEGNGEKPGSIIEFFGPFATLPGVYPLQKITITATTITNSVAGFGQSTVRILPDTDLTIGLRYTYEDRSFEAQEDGFLGNGTPLGSLLPPNPTFPLSQSVTKPTWRVALDHKFSEDVLAYISDNRGFRSGGYNGQNPSNAPYKPELLDAYEIGLKSEWLDHTLRLNAATFYYNYKDIQVTQYGATSTIYNGAAAELYGLDLDAEAKLGNLRLAGGVEWMHNKFTSFPDASISSPIPGGGASVAYASAAGNRLPYAPNLTFDLSGDYIVALPAGNLDFNVTNSYNDGYPAEPDNVLHQPAFDTLNSSITWNSSDRKYDVKLWATNLLDKAVASLLYTAVPLGYNAIYGNPPRTFGITASYKFGHE